MTMPVQKPGRSRQDYRTPQDLLHALKRRLGIHEFAVDLAADKDSTVSPYFHFTQEMDALVQDWNVAPGWGFCNPPYANIMPWVRKAEEESWHAQIAMLLPAGVGSNWWRDYVHDKAHVLLLNGRITFVGETLPYPKDCVILLYTNYAKGGYEVWNWRQDVAS